MIKLFEQLHGLLVSSESVTAEYESSRSEISIIIQVFCYKL